MKNILKTILLSVLVSGAMVSCDDATDIPYIDKPFFKESFDNDFPNWGRYSEVGAQVWVSDPTHGVGTTSNPCAKMSGFATTSNANIDWLISPRQDLSKFTTASFAFQSAYNFAGPVIEVYVSNNYSGTGNPNAAGVTWTKYPYVKLPTKTPYVYEFSGITDVSQFTGIGNEAVYFAFKYTSTTTASSTWEVDNFKVYNTNRP